ncbi:hypothetical protein [Hydrogenophaga crassostreae]|nr:hypothetical protein [Hydrogenophaga crassostreae]
MSHPFSPHELCPSSIELAMGRHPFDVQHAPYAIADYLEQLGLSNWTNRVMGYLRMYDGIESWLEPSDTEAVEFVRQILAKESQRNEHPKEDAKARRFRLAVALANAPVASYGAAFRIQRSPDEPGRAIWWNPLEQTWLMFLAQRETLPDYTRLYVTGPCEFRATPDDLITYLMER